MSLSSTYSEVYYTADGITSTFSFGNYFTGISSDYVKCIVYIDNSPLIPTYTVNLSVGGLTIVAITTPEGEALNLPPAGSIVRIYRDVPEAQNITSSELQNFTATQLEKSFDDIVGMIQEISYTLANKTINLTETNRAMSIDFLDSTNDGCIFYWDSANNKLVPTNYSEDEIVLSSSVRYLKYNAGVFSFSTNGTTWNALLQESNITSLREQVATNTENIATNTADILANETILNDHIADLDNPHETTKAQVGLGNADNTSDLDKPISTATQTELNAKQATLTTPQLSAVNSGIDSTKVAQIATNTTNIALKLDSNQGSTNVGKIMAVGADGELYPSSESGGIVSVNHDTTLTGSGIDSIPLGVSSSLLTTINGKQDALTTEQQSAVDSGIDSTKVAQIATNTTNIATNTGDIAAIDTILTDHIADIDNPHETTKEQVGLGNVDNTSDLDKPISTATQAALDTKGFAPIGSFISIPCTSDYVPDGCLPCDGYEYTKAQFTALWTNYLTSSPVKLQTCSYAEYASDITTYGQCGKFAIDTVNETFKTPTIKNGSVIQQAASDTELGKSYNAGLPNITGAVQFKGQGGGSSSSASGAFSYTAQGSGGSNDGANAYYMADFNASRSNPIYGNSTTVQPNAVALRFFVVVANGEVNQSQIDWSAWASSLAGKANTDLSNVTATGKEAVIGWGMPDYSSSINFPFPLSGSKYIAPQNGYYMCSFNIDGTTQQILNINGVDVLKRGHHKGYREDQTIMTIPLKKGDVIYWSIGYTDLYLNMFVPCIGG